MKTCTSDFRFGFLWNEIKVIQFRIYRSFLRVLKREGEEEMTEKTEERYYKPSEVSKTVGVTPDLLRKWVDAFALEIDTTDKGHRRYTKKDIELLITISKKINEQKWSWKQVRSWLNGDEESFVEHEEKSRLEQKLDKQSAEMAEMKEMMERQEQFNQVLVERLENLHQYIREELPQRQEIEKRDVQLLETIRKKQEEHEVERMEEVAATVEKKGFWKKIFG